jgi:hypothetical protein
VVNWHLIIARDCIPFDSIDSFFPQSVFVVRSLLRGDAPWWNPIAFSGLPVLGDAQSMIFTPHTLTGLLLGADFGLTSFDLTTLACPLAGAGALMVYGSRSGGSGIACLLAGVTFLLGGVATSRLQHVTEMISYGIIPLILLASQQRPGGIFVLMKPGMCSVVVDLVMAVQ